MKRNEYLDAAFNYAVERFNVNAAEETLNKRIIATSMVEYAKEHKLDFTEDEIKTTIDEDFKRLEKVGEDYKFQTWSMR